MDFFHKNLANGRWQQLSLSEQLGNVGSEVSRALYWRKKDQDLFNRSIDRALELLDLTIQDQRWRKRLKELTRARELFCDAVFNEGRLYGSTLEDFDRYFLQFAVAARN